MYVCVCLCMCVCVVWVWAGKLSLCRICVSMQAVEFDRLTDCFIHVYVCVTDDEPHQDNRSSGLRLLHVHHKVRACGRASLSLSLSHLSLISLCVCVCVCVRVRVCVSTRVCACA